MKLSRLSSQLIGMRWFKSPTLSADQFWILMCSLAFYSEFIIRFSTTSEHNCVEIWLTGMQCNELIFRFIDDFYLHLIELNTNEFPFFFSFQLN